MEFKSVRCAREISDEYAFRNTGLARSLTDWSVPPQRAPVDALSEPMLERRSLRIPKWEGAASETTLSQLRLRYVRVGFLASAYVNLVGEEPATTLLHNLAEPLTDAAKRLKRPHRALIEEVEVMRDVRCPTNKSDYNAILEAMAPFRRVHNSWDEEYINQATLDRRGRPDMTP